VILDTLAASQWSYNAGTSGTVTTPAGMQVTGVAAYATAGGATLTITPKGANQSGVAGDALPIPANAWFSIGLLGELGPGSIFAFSGTAAYFVQYAKLRSG